jgi:dTDP-glucose 4,6-dehydratase
MARILITGGAGFIGSHLGEFFLTRGHEVVCVDNLLTGNLENISGLFGNKRFRFIEHDISRELKLPGRLDHVLHFASPASPIEYLELPLETLKVGSLGTFNSLELAKDKKAGFLFASTSEVYGDPLVRPQREDYWGNVNPVGPRSCYDEAKRFSEALTMAYQRTYGVRTKIVRIFNTYGPRMRPNDGRVVPAFITQALRGEDLTIFGDGTQTRSFCFVDDLVEGVYRLMLSTFGEPVNLGNPREMSILDFAKEILRLTGSPSRVTFKPLPTDDPKVRRPDISRAKKVLGWEPRVPLEIGLRHTIDYFAGLKEAAVAATA